jgi:PPOX class probable F420-dependent enzyme
LDPDEARRRLLDAEVARLATITPTGAAHLVPICFVLRADTIYSAVDSKPKASHALQRFDNVAATGTAAVLADHYDADWRQLWWARADGAGRAVDDAIERADAVAALRAKYSQYADHPLDAGVLAIDVRTWTGWAASPDTSPAPGR